ncbi:MAG: hypothetical protein KAV87_33780 [Desulfobacteraceae bacterium]|nr:hypothetical protein [Desulfobacteraceae bacterium]
MVMKKDDIRIHKVTPGKDMDELGFRAPPRKKKPSKYPFSQMNVGDFFSITIPMSEPNTKEKRRAMTTALRLAARRYGKDLGKKFVTRETDKGARVWRSR